MLRPLFPLALQSTVRKRRSSLLVFTVLLLSFACAIVNISLTGSISHTNEEYRLNSYGEWYLAFPSAEAGDGGWLRSCDWAGCVVSASVYGANTYFGNAAAYSVIGEDYTASSRIALRSGHLPQCDDEVALEEWVLAALGIETPQIGQSITLSFDAVTTAPEDGTILTLENGQWIPAPLKSVECSVYRSFTLCGVLENYSRLWSFSHEDGKAVIGIALTEAAARDIVGQQNREIAAKYAGTLPLGPKPQYFVHVSAENRSRAATQAAGYLLAAHGADALYVNEAAYPRAEGSLASPGRLYPLLIAVVALVAVLCVYMMQLPAEVHSFSILRSIGITRPQLLTLSMAEAALLAAPAMLLGIPLGAGLTKLALRLLVYTDGVSVKAAIPRDTMCLLLLLWLAVIAMARVVLFLVVSRTPLTGRMQLPPRKARRQRALRSGVTALLILVFCAAFFYMGKAASTPKGTRNFCRKTHDYLLGSAFSVTASGGTEWSTISPTTLEWLRVLPGVERVDGAVEVYSYGAGPGGVMQAGLSFDGLGECFVDLIMPDEQQYAALCLPDAERKAFCDGEIVLLFLPGAGGAAPAGDILLSAWHDGARIGELSAVPKLWSKTMLDRDSRLTIDPTGYTVVCSEAYMRRLVSAVEPGRTWGCYRADGAFGYSWARLYADENAAALSLNYMIGQVMRAAQIGSMEDRYEANQTAIQNATQELILLYACGGCVALVTLLLLMSALAMEAEQEKRSFTILRVIGMSKKQMRRKVVGKALLRGGLAVLVGLAVYAGISIRSRMTALAVPFADAVPAAWRAFTYYGGSLSAVMLLAFALLALLLLASLIAKRGLREGERLK